MPHHTMTTNYGLETVPDYGVRPAGPRQPRPQSVNVDAPERTAALAQSGRVGGGSGGGHLTLDRIVSDGRLPIPRADPAEAMLIDRQRTQHLGLDDAITQLQWRCDLYRQHMDELQQAELTILNAHRTWADLWGIVDDRRDPELRRELDGVEQQRREERLSLWRDLSRLRQAVPDWAERYLSAYRKVQLVKDGGGYV